MIGGSNGRGERQHAVLISALQCMVGLKVPELSCSLGNLTDRNRRPLGSRARQYSGIDGNTVRKGYRHNRPTSFAGTDAALLGNDKHGHECGYPTYARYYMHTRRGMQLGYGRKMITLSYFRSLVLCLQLVNID